MKTLVRLSITVFLAGALAACSSAPGDEDLRSATRALLTASGTPSMSDAFKKQIEGMKVISCAKTDSGAYQCEVIGLMGTAQTMRLVKSSEGWRIVQ